MLALLWIPDWIWHPMNGKGYQFWSGIGGYLTVAGAILLRGLSEYRQRRCHVRRCWRVAWHPDPVHDHPVCRRHHPQAGRCVEDPDGGSMMLEEE